VRSGEPRLHEGGFETHPEIQTLMPVFSFLDRSSAWFGISADCPVLLAATRAGLS